MVIEIKIRESDYTIDYQQITPEFLNFEYNRKQKLLQNR